MSGSSSGSSMSTDDGGACAVTASSIRITEVDVGVTVVNNELDSNPPNPGLMPLAISPIPGGGSRLAWMGNDSMVHIVQLDTNDQVVSGSSLGLPAVDFQDILADGTGGVVLVSRAAMGGGNLNCGTLSNLCGTMLPSTDPCYDLYMVRFDGSAETWATKLTDATAALPPYSTGPTGPNVVFIWWYAHNGRLAWSGTNYAAYFGAAVSTSQMCTTPSTLSTGINIHQGDRLSIVNPSGAIQMGGWSWGCSHSGYERVVWDGATNAFAAVCKSDTYPQPGLNFNASALVRMIDLSYSNLGNLVAGAGGYWLTLSDIRSGQTANSDGDADVHLIHFTASGGAGFGGRGASATVDKDIVLASDSGLNDRAPHLAAYGNNRLLAAWETSSAAGDLTSFDTSRKLYVQSIDATTGTAEGAAFQVSGVTGNRYQDFRAYPDGSVAYPAPGSTGTKIKIVRVLPCP
jgi:hypothetical protein